MPAFVGRPLLDCFALAALGLAMTGRSPSLRGGASRRSNPGTARATDPMPAFVGRPFLDCFALAALGLAMTGEGARRRNDDAVIARSRASGDAAAGLRHQHRGALQATGAQIGERRVGVFE